MYSFSVEVASHLAVRVDRKPMTTVVESRDGVANRVELVRCGCGVVIDADSENSQRHNANSSRQAFSPYMRAYVARL